LTVKIATPEAFVDALGGAMLDEPAAWPRETVLPATTFEFASFNVTVTVDAAIPSARTELGLAEAVDLDALTASGVKSTDAVWETVTASLVSVAV